MSYFLCYVFIEFLLCCFAPDTCVIGRFKKTYPMKNHHDKFIETHMIEELCSKTTYSEEGEVMDRNMQQTFTCYNN